MTRARSNLLNWCATRQICRIVALNDVGHLLNRSNQTGSLMRPHRRKFLKTLVGGLPSLVCLSNCPLRGQAVAADDLPSAAQSSSESTPVPLSELTRVVGLANLRAGSIRGVNYYPCHTPWSGMWRDTPDSVWDEDMARAAEKLHVNAVRIFVEDLMPRLDNGQIDPKSLARLDRFLEICEGHGIRAVVCGFQTDDQPRSFSANRSLLAAHLGDPRVLMWDVENEPGGASCQNYDYRRIARTLEQIEQTEVTGDRGEKVAEAEPHLTTVGVHHCGNARLREVGALPDVVQYHEFGNDGENGILQRGNARVRWSIEKTRAVTGTRPLMIGEFGLPTSDYSEAEQLKLYQHVLDVSEAEGLVGTFPWCLVEFAGERLSPRERTFGLFDTKNRLKPAGELLAEKYRAWSNKG